MQFEFDELSYDVQHNRILKTTIENLLYTDGVNNEQKDSLDEMAQYSTDDHFFQCTSKSVGGGGIEFFPPWWAETICLSEAHSRKEHGAVEVRGGSSGSRCPRNLGTLCRRGR